MKKYDALNVAKAFLLTDKLSKNIEELDIDIRDSDLSELGYKGDTPLQTLRSLLREDKENIAFDKLYVGFKECKSRQEALANPEVRFALFAILNQKRFDKLQVSNTVELTVHEEGFSKRKELVGIRNWRALLPSDKAAPNVGPAIEIVEIHERITIDEAENLLEKSKCINI